MILHPRLHVEQSRHSFIRDLIPIYSGYQLVWCVGIVVIGGGVITALDLVRPSSILGTILGMLAVSYQSRPAKMIVAADKVRQIEDALREEGRYVHGDDGLWRSVKARWWNTWPHYSIEIIAEGSSATIFAAMPTIKRIRRGLAARQ
ncbi:hypothetical protein GGQ88_002764 [Novosphingobium hassiacum]|uniref:Uncharacterized protein n=1 Tax=Novosphingobium hassiacum TaxID=173676 RepID=A0A7W6A1E6_9SPHN|nr:hypothetical protein [Novosphingobium hassiacum]MBB3861480.1 hypothetical protein [Novosphingobium hassiacum]